MTKDDPPIQTRQARFRVSIAVDAATASMLVGKRITNISRGGIFIESPSPPPVSTEIGLAFRQPESQHVIVARGQVIWSDIARQGVSPVTPGVGIQFTEMPSESRSALEEWLLRLAR